jgi:hypothetical protein
MDSFTSLLQKEHMGELILTILFIIYLVMGFQLPLPVATIVDSILGKIFLLMIVVYLFSYSNPILAVLFLLVAIHMIRNSSVVTGNYGLDVFMPSEDKKSQQLTAFNQFPYTLEQEVVAKMAPIYHGAPTTKPSYRPVLENLYDASKVSRNN